MIRSAGPGGLAVVGGALARRPRMGGHAWALLQWVLGFRSLGWQVLFLDRIEASPEAARRVAWFDAVVERLGLADHAALRVGDEWCRGPGRSRTLQTVRDADLVLDIMGYLDVPEIAERARSRVFLDIDPGFGQMWQALGQSDLFNGYDSFVTVGSNLGDPDSRVPACGLDWITTLPPVSLPHWPAARGTGRAFRSVATWRGPFDPIVYRGETYGLRVHEFRRFADLPRITSLPFELALDIDREDAADRERLISGGWRLLDPSVCAGNPGAYQKFVWRSAGEICVAKQLYVRSRGGWFSDRSACFLASGRPVLAQDTGLRDRFPDQRGLWLFDDPAEAADGARIIMADHERHSSAARDLAAAHFDARVVIRRMLRALSGGEPSRGGAGSGRAPCGAHAATVSA